MTEPPFRGPKLKIERAERHIRDLQAAIDAFLARDPYPHVVEDDAERGVRWVKMEVRELVPAELGLIAGDAIHNLRSALDIMLCDIAAMHGDASRSIRFPFRQDADELETLTDKMVKRLPIEIIALISKLKLYKAENGGNKLLRALHDLDIIDKHKLIVTTAAFRGVMHSHPDETATITSYGALVGDGVVMQFALANVADEQPQITTAITFGDGQPFQGEPIVPTLRQLANLVSEIVEAFAGLYRP